MQVHVAHVVVDGVIKGPRTVKYNKPDEDLLLPDAIADTYWHLHAQDKCAVSWSVHACMTAHACSNALEARIVTRRSPSGHETLRAAGAAGPRSWTCAHSPSAGSRRRQQNPALTTGYCISCCLCICLHLKMMGRALLSRTAEEHRGRQTSDAELSEGRSPADPDRGGVTSQASRQQFCYIAPCSLCCLYPVWPQVVSDVRLLP